MHRRTLLFAAVVVLLRVTLSPAAAQDQRCFPETGKCISGVIRTYWENTGGLPVYGYPITDQVVETNTDGFTGPTQWFERGRMEAHPENQPPFDILLGLLGNEIRGSNPPVQPAPPTNPPPTIPQPPAPNLPAPSFNNCQADPNASVAPNNPVQIVRIDKSAEVVTLRNVSSAAINLNGWIMCSITGNQRHDGIGGSLAAGETRAFPYTGPGQIWLNSGKDDGALYNPNGQLVSYYVDR